MRFTAAELAEMAAADAAIDAEFEMTEEERAAAATRDREHRLAQLPESNQRRAAYQREYRQAHKAEAAARQREYYQAHKEERMSEEA